MTKPIGTTPSVELPFDCGPLFVLVAATGCLVFGALFLLEAIEHSAYLSLAYGIPFLALGAAFAFQLVAGPRTVQINLVSGEVRFNRGWPCPGMHSAFSLATFRRVYYRSTRPAGNVLLAVINHLGEERTIARCLAPLDAENAAALISSHLGLANDSLIT
jgi:hypothetical protein